MSASHEWTEWHLTPTGWQRGSEKVDFAGVKEVQPPADRALTCVYDESLGSTFGRMHKTTDILWRSENELLLTHLLKKYGDCPERL